MAGPPRVLPRSAVEGSGKAGRSGGARGVGRGHGVAVVAAPLVTMGWLASHAPAPPAPSLAQVVCMANLPVATVRSNDPPLVPGRSQPHLSAFSPPVVSVRPRAGLWWVFVSAYSW